MTHQLILELLDILCTLKTYKAEIPINVVIQPIMAYYIAMYTM